MTASLIDGKAYAEGLRQRIAGAVAELQAAKGVTPGLAVVLVGEDPPAGYVRSSRQSVEIYGELEHRLPEHAAGRPAEADRHAQRRSPCTASWCSCRCPSTSPPAVIRAIDPQDRRPAPDECRPPLQIAAGEPLTRACTPLGCLMLIRDLLAGRRRCAGDRPLVLVGAVAQLREIAPSPRRTRAAAPGGGPARRHRVAAVAARRWPGATGSGRGAIDVGINRAPTQVG